VKWYYGEKDCCEGKSFIFLYVAEKPWGEANRQNLCNTMKAHVGTAEEE
jgi:hypothetical protein